MCSVKAIIGKYENEVDEVINFRHSLEEFFFQFFSSYLVENFFPGKFYLCVFCMNKLSFRVIWAQTLI